MLLLGKCAATHLHYFFKINEEEAIPSNLDSLQIFSGLLFWT